jgi:2-dehydropantoate 2-reductase
MRIAVMGAGGTGGCLGGLLARAGNEVILIARGEHLDAIRRNGLRVKSHLGDFTVKPEATDNPGDVGPVELVLFTVKTYHNGKAVPATAPLVEEVTAVMPLQNGVESFDQLARGLGPECVLPGASYGGAHIESPGVISQQSHDFRIVFGELDGSASIRARRIQDTFSGAGIEAELSADVVKALWTKLLLLAPVSGATSASRVRIKQLLQYPEPRQTFLAAMREVEAVGRAKGVHFDPDIVEKMARFIESYPDFQNSMHIDIELGRPLELDALNGAVVRLGREAGVPTPVNSLLYSILAPHKDGGTAKS